MDHTVANRHPKKLKSTQSHKSSNLHHIIFVSCRFCALFSLRHTLHVPALHCHATTYFVRLGGPVESRWLWRWWWRWGCLLKFHTPLTKIYTKFCCHSVFGRFFFCLCLFKSLMSALDGGFWVCSWSMVCLPACTWSSSSSSLFISWRIVAHTHNSWSQRLLTDPFRGVMKNTKLDKKRASKWYNLVCKVLFHIFLRCLDTVRALFNCSGVGSVHAGALLVQVRESIGVKRKKSKNENYECL